MTVNRKTAWLLILLNSVVVLYSYENIQQLTLSIHNQFRRQHSSPALRLDEELNSLASRCTEFYVSQKKIDHKCPFYDLKLGENLGSGRGNHAALNFTESIIKAWYKEINLYDYAQPVFSTATGHFTQMVWKESTKLGVAYAEADNYHVLVCVYSPKGNMKGQFQNNVLKAGAVNETKSTEPSDILHANKKKMPAEIKIKSFELAKRIGTEQDKVRCSSTPPRTSSPALEYQVTAVSSQNELRVKHNSANLSLDGELSGVAIKCAEHLVRKQGKEMKCPFLGKIGQNIGAGYGKYTPVTFIENAVKRWYKTGQHYDYTKAEFSSKTGHFTQLVWKGSNKVGVGYAEVNGFHAAVVIYCPPGNIKGKFAENVEKPKLKQ